jgi:uncharacterized protein (DUF2062 family)
LKGIEKFGSSYDKLAKTSQKVTAFMIAKGQIMGNAITSMASSMKDSILEFYPAMNQTFTMAKNVMLANFVSPIAKDLTPILVKFMKMISANRDVFVKMGRIVLETFKLIYNIIKNFVTTLTKSWSGMWDTINGGKKSIDKFFMFINMMTFKIGMAFIFLQIRLEYVIEAIGAGIKYLFLNVIQPFFTGLLDGFGGQFSKALNTLIGSLNKLVDAFKKVFTGSDEEIELVQSLFYNLGETVGWLAGVPLVLLADAFDMVVDAINYLIDVVNDPIKAIKEYDWYIQALAIIAVPALMKSLIMLSVKGISSLTMSIATKAIPALFSFSKSLLAPIASVVKFMFSLIALGVKGFIALIPSISAAAASMWTFTVALLANPITWIVIGIVALIAGLILLYKNFDKISKFFTEWYKKLKDFIIKWKELFMNSDIVVAFKDKVVTAFTTMWNQLKLFGDKIKQKIADMFEVKGLSTLINYFKKFSEMSNTLPNNKDKGGGGDKEPQKTGRKIVEVKMPGITRNEWYEVIGDKKIPLGNSTFSLATKDDEYKKVEYGKGSAFGMQFRDGGIARGSKSGYQATLHGTEAVIPLKGGNIPLLIKGQPSSPIFNDNRTVTINIVSNKPDEVRKEVENVMKENKYKQDYIRAGLRE